MANFSFDYAKGRIVHYASLPASNDALIVVPIEATGIQADSAMRVHANLAALLAASSNEQTSMGRKTATGVTVTVDTTNHWVDVDMADPTWTSASGAAIAALVICYNPDTTGGSDTDLIPLVKLDCALTPDGGDLVGTVPAAGFFRAN